MDRQPMTYGFPAVRTLNATFNGIGIIRGRGNSLIINELEQKPSDFTENLLKEYSGGSSSCSSSSSLEGINAINAINALKAAAIFLPKRKHSPLMNKSHAK